MCPGCVIGAGEPASVGGIGTKGYTGAEGLRRLVSDTSAIP